MPARCSEPPIALAWRAKTGQSALVALESNEAIDRWPMEALTEPDGSRLTKVEDVGMDEAKSMMRGSSPSIAIVNLGDSVRWCLGSDALAVWASEVRSHLIDPDQRGFLEDFPDRYFYTASRWSSTDGTGEALVCFKNH
jgi:hypothetical protein